ncbi:hypothetical protein EAG_08184 [Camponotus floridanus]|uniref:Uncharacterized protein n=1 Tax=Camponotus floridanus TaxID=104421 RepID=E2AP97_CAMFO|nr:hypothetical protein EAG_08184 [Camponotus floridanus]
MNRTRAQGELTREDGVRVRRISRAENFGDDPITKIDVGVKPEGEEEEEETRDEDLGLPSGVEKEKVITAENQVVCHTLGTSLEEEFPETGTGSN